jgi:membrane protease YdiL (CAAX protease family)
VILRAAMLLVRLRARRLLNLFTGKGLGRFSRKSAPRSGTDRPRSWAFPAVVIALQALAAVLMSWSIILQARMHLDGEGIVSASNIAPLSAGVLGEVALLASMACVVGLLMGLSSRELSSPDWDLEWLATLPIPMRQLLAVRLVERALLNPVAVLTVWSLLSVAALHEGAGWLAPLVGLVVALPLLLVVGSLHLLVDTGLRLRLTPPQLRNVQALASLLGLVGLYVLISAGPSQASFVHDWARNLPPALLSTPMGLAVRALAAHDLPAALALLGLEWLACAAFALVVLALLAHLLRFGLLAAGARESSRHERVSVAAKPPRRLVTALQARELKLLSRDRAFLVQTMVLPVVILGAQFVFNMRLYADVFTDPRGLGSVAFAVMAYALMFSTFQTLAAEGHALWLLFTFPQPLDQLLREKARLWSVVAMVFPSAIFAIGLWISPRPDWSAAGVAALVLIGVPIFATIGTCLGVLGWDPLALDQRRRIRSGWATLYMLLAGVYGVAVAKGDWWTRVQVVILMAALAFSLWQRVRDRLPWLLDPGSRPPPLVSLSDGILAALLLFVLQVLTGLGLGWLFHLEMPGDPIVLPLTYSISAALTFLVMRAIFQATRTQGVPRYSGSAPLLRAAALPALLAAAGGVGWLLLLRGLGLFQQELGESLAVIGNWSMVLVLVVADPLFEEFLFRGLVYGGLRRSRGVLVSVLASAAIFAVLHPLPSAPPVFLMGVLAALACEATGSLAAPVIVHATYNAAVVAAQMLLR